MMVIKNLFTAHKFNEFIFNTQFNAENYDL